ncbi:MULTISPECIES: hypothetical protein [unclassified Spirosoma]|uniref:hypothetical protein n=1 Tax=unclassified Spirosoma TaxID=2621999 RepID=UPI0009691140|nr:MULTISPECIES: hypothetical protein [unclassified Spirosoma]MBN8820972.1 hypothetical protein [Spirosoma sp.]OJW75980.1 MAG: hypothetical protein BGO59_03885 [Spirosoma sp. 48-14]
MKTALLLLIGCMVSGACLGQEGRPALEAETAEDERVKTIIQKALPHDLPDWRVEDESKTTGVTWFHDGGAAVKYPFAHGYSIRYVRQNVSEAEKDQWRKIAVDVAGVQKMLDETECEIKVRVNGFSSRLETDGTAQKRGFPSFDLALIGPHESRLMMGIGWNTAKAEALDDQRMAYSLLAPLNRAMPMTQIQTVLLEVKGSPAVLDYFLKQMDIAALRTLVGAQKISNQAISSAKAVANEVEKPLTNPLAGINEIEFTLNGGNFQNRHIRLKHSSDGEFGYLRNNHPNPTTTENAVTRILIQEDDDFKTKMKSGFLDITIPFIRKTGTFEVYAGAEKASFSGGINCWDGCEYSFDANGLTVTVTRYDPVGGFIEGTFTGDVKVGYRLNQPLDNDQKKRPNAQINGRFKVRRKADRF